MRSSNLASRSKMTNYLRNSLILLLILQSTFLCTTYGRHQGQAEFPENDQVVISKPTSNIEEPSQNEGVVKSMAGSETGLLDILFKLLEQAFKLNPMATIEVLREYLATSSDPLPISKSSSPPTDGPKLRKLIEAPSTTEISEEEDREQNTGQEHKTGSKKPKKLKGPQPESFEDESKVKVNSSPTTSNPPSLTMESLSQGHLQPPPPQYSPCPQAKEGSTLVFRPETGPQLVEALTQAPSSSTIKLGPITYKGNFIGSANPNVGLFGVKGTTVLESENKNLPVLQINGPEWALEGFSIIRGTGPGLQIKGSKVRAAWIQIRGITSEQDKKNALTVDSPETEIYYFTVHGDVSLRSNSISLYDTKIVDNGKLNLGPEACGVKLMRVIVSELNYKNVCGYTGLFGGNEIGVENGPLVWAEIVAPDTSLLDSTSLDPLEEEEEGGEPNLDDLSYSDIWDTTAQKQIRTYKPINSRQLEKVISLKRDSYKIQLAPNTVYQGNFEVKKGELGQGPSSIQGDPETTILKAANEAKPVLTVKRSLCQLQDFKVEGKSGIHIPPHTSLVTLKDLKIEATELGILIDSFFHYLENIEVIAPLTVEIFPGSTNIHVTGGKYYGVFNVHGSEHKFKGPVLEPYPYQKSENTKIRQVFRSNSVSLSVNEDGCHLSFLEVKAVKAHFANKCPFYQIGNENEFSDKSVANPQEDNFTTWEQGDEERSDHEEEYLMKMTNMKQRGPGAWVREVLGLDKNEVFDLAKLKAAHKAKLDLMKKEFGAGSGPLSSAYDDHAAKLRNAEKILTEKLNGKYAGRDI